MQLSTRLLKRSEENDEGSGNADVHLVSLLSWPNRISFCKTVRPPSEIALLVNDRIPTHSCGAALEAVTKLFT